MKVTKEIKTAEEAFEHFKLKEHAVYLVRVKHYANNYEHESFLFTGFKNGNYCLVYNNSGEPTPMMKLYSMKVIKLLYTKATP